MNRALYAHKTALRLKQHLDHMSLRVSIFNNHEGELDEWKDSSWLEEGVGRPAGPEDLTSHPGASSNSQETYAFAPYPYLLLLGLSLPRQGTIDSSRGNLAAAYRASAPLTFHCGGGCGTRRAHRQTDDRSCGGLQVVRLVFTGSCHNDSGAIQRGRPRNRQPSVGPAPKGGGVARQGV
jgi:hypothetical protein